MNDLKHEGISNELPVCRPATLDNGGNFVAVIERLASNPDVDPVKLEKFMDLQERILDRNAEQAFNIDMVQCQSDIRAVFQNKRNTQTNSRYADLEAVILSVKPIYTKHGFALSFYEGETKKENHIRICVDVMHKYGHTKSRYVDMAIDDTGAKGSATKTKIHGEGSAISYGRRYLTCMIFNIPTSDDNDSNTKTEYISEKQVADIQSLATEVKADVNRLLKYLGFTSLSKIPVSQYERTIQELERKRK